MILDPISLEIIWNRLVAAADEAAAAVVRTSFSTNVRESNDYACVLTDAVGNLLAENRASIPAFCDCLGRSAKLFLEHFPVGSWKASRRSSSGKNRSGKIPPAPASGGAATARKWSSKSRPKARCACR